MASGGQPSLASLLTPPSISNWGRAETRRYQPQGWGELTASPPTIGTLTGPAVEVRAYPVANLVGVVIAAVLAHGGLRGITTAAVMHVSAHRVVGLNYSSQHRSQTSERTHASHLLSGSYGYGQRRGSYARRAPHRTLGGFRALRVRDLRSFANRRMVRSPWKLVRSLKTRPFAVSQIHLGTMRRCTR